MNERTVFIPVVLGLLLAGLACNLPVGLGTGDESELASALEIDHDQGSQAAQAAKPTEPLPAATSNPPTLTPAPTPYGGGSMIAYLSSGDTSNVDLYAVEVRADGIGEPIILSQDRHDNQNLSAPNWHPSGQSVTVTANNFERSSSEVLTFLLNPSEPVFTNFSDSSGGFWFAPLWAPAGDRFAANQFTQDGVMAYTFMVDGSGPQPLAPGYGDQLVLDWSQGGYGLLFLVTSELSETNAAFKGDLFHLEDTTDSAELVASDLIGLNLARSPEGSQILYDTNVNGNQDIYVMAIDDSGAQPLMASPDPEFNPSWSPDGQHILFTRQVEQGDRDIYIMNADGSNPRALITGAGFQDEAVWGP